MVHDVAYDRSTFYLARENSDKQGLYLNPKYGS